MLWGKIFQGSQKLILRKVVFLWTSREIIGINIHLILGLHFSFDAY